MRIEEKYFHPHSFFFVALLFATIILLMSDRSCSKFSSKICFASEPQAIREKLSPCHGVPLENVRTLENVNISQFSYRDGMIIHNSRPDWCGGIHFSNASDFCSHTCLIIFAGKSFRSGAELGKETIFQVEATATHLQFLNFLASKHKFVCDVHVYTISTPFTDMLCNLYRAGPGKFLSCNSVPYSKYGGGGSFLWGIQKEVFAEQRLPPFAYDWALLIRIDLVLKPFFSDVFDPFSQQILVPTTTFRRGADLNYLVYGEKRLPRIANTMLFAPRQFYSCIFRHDLSHELFAEILLADELPPSSLGTMISTLHDSNTEADWNPLYYMSGRRQCCFWDSPGFEYQSESATFTQSSKFLTMADFGIFQGFGSCLNLSRSAADCARCCFDNPAPWFNGTHYVF